MKPNSRRKAVFVLSRWLLTHEFPNELLPRHDEDRAFVQDLVYTTIRYFRPLRAVLGKFLVKWPKGELEALVLVGAAQILYMDDVPDFAAVNETVAAAKCCRNRNIPKVVNGVLRSLLRKIDEVKAFLAAAPLAERESYPNALVKRWIERYGEEKAAELAKWHNTPAEVWLASPDGYRKLDRGIRVTDVEGYDSGAFIVQDPAHAMAIDLLDVKPGQKVLDACAAPGGKSVRIAWRMKGEGELLACEVNLGRLQKLQDTLKRCKLDWVKSSPFIPEDGTFDRVLVDAPCSNTGVLRRRPDARWRWDAAHLEELTKLQSDILDKVAPLVAPGGILVYSTCSNEPEENADQVAAFLARHAEFEKIRDEESVPFVTQHDGAYACALRRK